MASTTRGYAFYTTDIVTTKQFPIPTPVSSEWFQIGDDKGQQAQEEQRLDSFVSDFVVDAVDIVVTILLCGIISALGLVANAINILVFIRQGVLSSSSNVSLLALAFADIGCLLPVFCNSINYAVFHLGHVGIFLTPKDFFNTAVIRPHIMCMQITSWITAYIAFERSMCVVFPLKVKFIFSAKRSAIITTCIAVVAIASFLPTFLTLGVQKVTDSSTNKTGFIFVPTESHFKTIDASDKLDAYTLRPLTLLIVFGCTQITVYRIKLSASWRKSIVKAASSSATKSTKTGKQNGNSCDPSSEELSKIPTIQDSKMSSQITDDQTTASDTPDKQNSHAKPQKTNFESKEIRLVKMITAISVIFMVCNAPDILSVFLLFYLRPKYQISNADNMFSVLVAGMLCLESINSAINILVYYRMSSTYKQAFLALVRRQ